MIIISLTPLTVIYVLAVRKVGHLSIKTKIFNFKARVLTG